MSDARDPSASVFIIGMRGAGKTYVGKLAAASLGWKFIDADDYFEEKERVSIQDFIHQHGWPAFRTTETEFLSYLVETYPTKHVISLGGGIVETPAARKILKDYTECGLVINVVRVMDDMLGYLGSTSTAHRPAYSEPILNVFKRRQPWFVECSTHEFVNIPRGTSAQDLRSSPDDALRVKKASEDAIHVFFGHITGHRPNLAPNLAPGRRSYFLSFNHHDVTQLLPHIENLTVGIDAVEIRVDCLRDFQSYDSLGRHIPNKSYVANQIGAIQRETPLPIVFTVRTVSHGGAFPDDAEAEAFDLMYLALRLGVEYIDVQVTWSAKRIFELSSQKGSSKIIASWHDQSGNAKWNGLVIQEKYQVAYQFGDIVKLVCAANDVEDNLDLFHFVSKVSSIPNAKPIIALNMGPKGQLSRILCKTFSPCTHPLLPKKAAPGQLSFAEIQTGLHLLGFLPARRFFLFGSSISKSMSPTLHNTAFKLFGLPHTYELFQTTGGEEIRSTIASHDFGGASVTIPFKIDVIPLLDKLSPSAQAIGAVNTIISRDPETAGSGRILFGDNTDWKAIRECLRGSMLSDWPIEVALVLGAGGTARAAIYALHDLGAKQIYVFNRTASQAHSLASHFVDFGVEVLHTLGKWSVAPNIIISCIPAAATTTAKAGSKESVYLPSSLFDAKHGVVIDMAYTPFDTPLISLAKSVAGKTWAIIPGIDTLLEQGYLQFELWTGYRCPKNAVKEQVMKQFLADI
jgi:pentafunctional AROM polypeptide